MPTIAVLGATGQTGMEVIKYLLTDPDYQHYHINIWARSSSKIHETFPFAKTDSLSDDDKDGDRDRDRVTVFTGSLDDRETITGCLRGVDVIVAGIAQNRNEPGCDIAQRAAYSIVQALETIRTQNQNRDGNRNIWTCPRLVWISSASISPSSPSRKDMLFGQKVALYAVQYVYSDIKASIAYLQSFDWLPLVIAEPGALVHHDPTAVDLVVGGRGSEIVPYADFARAMVMMGTSEEGELAGKHVGIRVNGGEELSPVLMLPLVKYLLPGILGSFSPWLYSLGKGWWP